MLRPITLDEVVEVTGGALVDGPHVVGASGEEVCTSVSTDTRTIEPGALFVALKGENHDGHAYLAQARETGATGLVVSRTLTLAEAQLPHVVVADTLHALGDIARDIRDSFYGPVVGVTGSVGKTTAKEMISLVLGAKFNVHKSAENFNNEIGVPQTIFEMTPEHGALVVEMGMRGPGQIRRLAEIAAPTIGVITNIGLSHIELLGSRDAIADAKGELFECLPEADGVAIYPAQDDFADRLKARFRGKTLSCAVDGMADVRAVNLTATNGGWTFSVTSPGGSGEYFIPSPGRFNVLNALFAIAVGESVGLSHTEMAAGLKNYVPAPMRLEVLTSEKGATILSDAYNAAPDSMIGALQTLQGMPVGPGGKRIAVLGEMRELGAFANDAHSMVGRSVGRVKPDMLVTIGEMGRKIAAGAMVMGFSGDKIHQIATAGQAAQIVPVIVGAGDVVLVKGSRAMQMEQIVEALRPIPRAPVAPPPTSAVAPTASELAPELTPTVPEIPRIAPPTVPEGEPTPEEAAEAFDSVPTEEMVAAEPAGSPGKPSATSAEVPASTENVSAALLEDSAASPEVSMTPPPLPTVPENPSLTPPPLPTTTPPLPGAASEPESEEKTS